MSNVPEKCAHCTKDKTFHDVKILADGTIVETHACEDCAAEQGFLPMQATVEGVISLQPGGVRARACPECGLTFAQFKRVGRLGCPACYDAFERQLMGILDRSQQGGTHHVGKIPRRLLAEQGEIHGSERKGLEALLDSALHRAQRLKALGERLRLAVENEQYEQAARIRDEIRRASLDAGEPGSER